MNLYTWCRPVLRCPNCVIVGPNFTPTIIIYHCNRERAHMLNGDVCICLQQNWLISTPSFLPDKQAQTTQKTYLYKYKNKNKKKLNDQNDISWFNNQVIMCGLNYLFMNSVKLLLIVFADKRISDRSVKSCEKVIKFHGKSDVYCIHDTICNGASGIICNAVTLVTQSLSQACEVSTC